MAKPINYELKAKFSEIALLLFETQGYQKTTIRQIAEIAKCRPSNVYIYYKNKEELREAVLKETIDDLVLHMSKLNDYREQAIDRSVMIELILNYIRSKKKHLKILLEWDEKVNELLKAFYITDTPVDNQATRILFECISEYYKKLLNEIINLNNKKEQEKVLNIGLMLVEAGLEKVWHSEKAPDPPWSITRF